MGSVLRKVRRNVHQSKFGRRDTTEDDVARALLEKCGDMDAAADWLSISVPSIYRHVSQSRHLQLLKRGLELGVTAGLTGGNLRKYALDRVKELG